MKPVQKEKNPKRHMAPSGYPTYRIPNPSSDEKDQPYFYTPPEEKENQLPLKPIPGTYGWPFFRAIRDRWDFYYNQGRDGFFQARLEKYKSTVFRVNAPPGPFISKNPKVIVVLDALTFQILFDTEKVEKRDLLDGTYMPSVGYFGGYRVLAFIDPSEPKHKAIKSFCFSILASKKDSLIPTLRKNLDEVFTTLEAPFLENGSTEPVDFNKIVGPKTFEFLFELFCRTSPAEAGLGLGEEASKTVDLWLIAQIISLFTLGVPKILRVFEDLLIHTFPIPPILVRSKYTKIYKAFSESATVILDTAAEFGLERDEACHNLIFITIFNAYGGFKAFLPIIFKWLGRAGVTWHKHIAKEVRSVVNSVDGVTLASLEKMPLVKSTVYEVLRIDPPVPFQYGKAKEDLILESHDARYEVKKGEMIFGYQTFATKDPKVFERADEFVPSRFTGKSEANLKYVYWSNGRETESPTTDNKQCPGKDFVVLVARVLVAEFFLRFDTFTSTDKPFLAGATVNFTSLSKATPEFTKDLD